MSISKEQFIKYYAEQVERDEVSLFLGAGVSSSVGYPSWFDTIVEKNLNDRNILINSIRNEKDLSNVSSIGRVNVYKLVTIHGFFSHQK